MFTPKPFEDEVKDLGLQCEIVIIDCTSPTQSFRSLVMAAFRARAGRNYGIYLVRRLVDGLVVYVGKGGTVQPDGSTKFQDIPGRLLAPRGWAFSDLHRTLGSFQIQCFMQKLHPSISPAFMEALLLQAYLNTYGRLPQLNKSF